MHSWFAMLSLSRVSTTLSPCTQNSDPWQWALSSHLRASRAPHANKNNRSSFCMHRSYLFRVPDVSKGSIFLSIHSRCLHSTHWPVSLFTTLLEEILFLVGYDDLFGLLFLVKHVLYMYINPPPWWKDLWHHLPMVICNREILQSLTLEQLLFV